MAAIDDLHELATERGLDVRLEHPGVRWRLAVQTARARVRAGDAWYRRYVAMTDASSERMEDAARLLLRELAVTPPARGS